ncbi:MAG: hypothetical protein NC037_01395, partial [Bacteroides sp.]|nr:hypothetical protein [Bacteroides sp.]
MNFWERGNFNSQNDTHKNAGNGGCGRNDNLEVDVRNKFEQYRNKSEDQLLSELASTVARMKKD